MLYVSIPSGNNVIARANVATEEGGGRNEV